MLHMPQNNLSELLKSAQLGDQRAYNLFLQESTVFLRKRLTQWLKRREIIEEIVQEVLIGVHRNLHTYLPGRSAETWIIAISKYKIADYFRKNPHRFEELSENVTFDEEISNDLLEMLQELPLNLSEALRLTKVDGLSTKEAAKKLGIKENALRTRISRAIEKLKEEILT